MDLNKLQHDLLFSHDRLYGPATDGIKSFDHFMEHMMPYVVREFSKFELVSNNERHVVNFGDIVAHRPLIQDLEAPQKNIRILTNDPLMPMEARNRGLTYAADVFVNIDHVIYAVDTGAEIQRIAYREVPLMQMPIMVRSKFCHLSEARNLEALKECPNDPGGYFIFNGNEKVLQSQKVQRPNCHIVKHGGQGLPIDLEIRSVQADKKFRSTSTLYVHYSGTPLIMTADVPYLAEGQNIVLIFRALGLSGRAEIESFLWADPDDKRRRYFEATLNCAASDPKFNLQQVFDALGEGIYNETNLGTPEKIRRQVSQQITGEFLPHCGFDETEYTRFKKMVYLRTIVHHMLDVYCGFAPPDDRDFEGFKIVQMSASLLSTMFRQLFSAFVKSIRNKMFDRFKKSKHLDIAAFVAHSDTLTRDIMKAFSDGEVTVRQASNAGSSVIQIVHRINPLGLITDLQRVRTPLPPDGKYILMRGVDPTQLFAYCPAETPEGHGAGLLQNMALFAKARLGTESFFVISALMNIREFASSCGVHDVLLEPLTKIGQLAVHHENTIIFVNGDPVAVTKVPEALLIILRRARRAKVLPIDTSVIQAPHGIAIFTDMGTVQFPLICIETLKKQAHKVVDLQASGTRGELFSALVSLGIVEYVEAWEALDYRVAFKADDLKIAQLNVGLDGPLMPFSHLALHPMSFLGTAASTVPWSDHDQAPRVSYQAGMLKQAISTPAMNIHERFDQNYAFSTWYPQMPMADTAVSESRKLQEWPMGENLMIAIGSYDGLSQEDAIVRSAAGIDRGSGRITLHKVYKAVVHKISNTDYEAFENPTAEINGLTCIGIRGESVDGYAKLDIRGMLTEGIYVGNGDVLIGRVLYTTDDSGNRVRRDRSIIMTCEESESYIVDRIMVTTNRDGFRQVRVKVRTMRVPQIGDKISDRHGQKGVIGFLARQEDMPFVADGPNAGLVPDAIVNLHSINGRMTIGKLIEMLYSNLGLIKGSFVDASPFKNIDAQWAIQQLIDSGYGDEVTMINGKTGRYMTTPWFIGSCFYQSLKHMVLDKIAARNRGPRAPLTRQPVEGRAKQGGLRVGEMERDAFLAHGAAMTLDDRSRVASDGHVAAVCTKCGQIGETTTKFTLKGLLGHEKVATVRPEFGMTDTDGIDDTDAGGTDAIAGLIDAEDDTTDASEGLKHEERCRICNGTIERINTTYCYSNLLVRELATVGVKVEHFFSDTDLSSNLDDLMI